MILIFSGQYHDIDLKRLKSSQIVADNTSRSLRSTASIKATPDRREALKNADFVIVMIQVGGYKPSTVIDFEIPAKYGLQQTIADTLGIGGIMIPPIPNVSAIVC